MITKHQKSEIVHTVEVVLTQEELEDLIRDLRALDDQSPFYGLANDLVKTILDSRERDRAETKPKSNVEYVEY